MTRYGRPVARLTASTGRAIRLIGCARRQSTVPDDPNQGDDEAAALFAASNVLPG